MFPTLFGENGFTARDRLGGDYYFSWGVKVSLPMGELCFLNSGRWGFLKLVHMPSFKGHSLIPT